MKKILYAISYKLKVTRWKLQVESWKLKVCKVTSYKVIYTWWIF